MTEAPGVERQRHELEDPWPAFLDCLDTDPDRCWVELHRFVHRLVAAYPPPVYRDRPKEFREDAVNAMVLRFCEDDFRILRTYRRGRVPFAFWVRRSLVNRMRDEYRRERTALVHAERSATAPSFFGVDDVYYRRVLDGVRECVGTMKPGSRLYLQLAADGFKPAEMVRLLGLEAGQGKAVSDRLRYCRRLLRECLETKGFGPIFAGGKELDADAGS